MEKIKVLGESSQKAMAAHLADLVNSGRISDYDAFIAKHIAHVLGGGDVPAGSEEEEEVMLQLEEEAFLGLLKEKKTRDRISHMLKTGKPLRN